MKTVVTYHSSNYEHQKWGRFSKFFLKLGEKFAITFSDHVIFVSKYQADRINCQKKTHIPNGIEKFLPSNSNDYLKTLNIQPKMFILAVSRFSPEKGLHDLINAYKGIQTQVRLVIAGGADHENEYSRYLRTISKLDKRIILTGYINGDKLVRLYSNAKLFILPSHNEGNPIALLEAMSFNIPVIVSDIPQNREIGLPDVCHFKTGDTLSLQKKIIEHLGNTDKSLTSDPVDYNHLLNKFRWNRVADLTQRVYMQVVNS